MKEVYVVYGKDDVYYEELDNVICKPNFMEVFESLDDAKNFFREKCLEIAKYPKDDSDPIFPDLSDDEVFVDQSEDYEELYENDPDQDLFISYQESENYLEWYVFAPEEVDEYDSFMLPRVFLVKKKIKG